MIYDTKKGKKRIQEVFEGALQSEMQQVEKKGESPPNIEAFKSSANKYINGANKRLNNFNNASSNITDEQRAKQYSLEKELGWQADAIRNYYGDNEISSYVSEIEKAKSSNKSVSNYRSRLDDIENQKNYLKSEISKLGNESKNASLKESATKRVDGLSYDATKDKKVLESKRNELQTKYAKLVGEEQGILQSANDVEAARIISSFNNDQNVMSAINKTAEAVQQKQEDKSNFGFGSLVGILGGSMTPEENEAFSRLVKSGKNIKNLKANVVSTAAKYGYDVKPEDIDKLVDYVVRSNNAKTTAEVNEYFSELSKSHPIIANLIKVPLSVKQISDGVVSTVDVVADMFDGNGLKEIDPNSLQHMATNVSNIITKTTSDNLASKSTALKNVYELGTTIADNLVREVPFLIGGVATGGATLVPMAFQVFEQNLVNNAHAGMDTGSNIFFSFLSTGAEVATELIGGEALTKGITKSIAKKIATNSFGRLAMALGVNAGSEGIEEVINNLITDLGEGIYEAFGGKNSISQIELRNLLNQGMSYDEAKSKLVKEKMYDYIKSYAMGALSGGVMTGGVIATSSIANTVDTNRTVNDIMNSGNGKSVYERGLGYTGDTVAEQRARANARQVLDYYGSGGVTSNRSSQDFGNLFNPRKSLKKQIKLNRSADIQANIRYTSDFANTLGATSKSTGIIAEAIDGADISISQAKSVKSDAGALQTLSALSGVELDKTSSIKQIRTVLNSIAGIDASIFNTENTTEEEQKAFAQQHTNGRLSVYAEDGETILPIDDIIVDENNEISLVNPDGSVTKASRANFINETTKKVVAKASVLLASGSIDNAGAVNFIKNYDGSTDLATYSNTFMKAYNASKNGVDLDTVKSELSDTGVSNEALTSAYKSVEQDEVIAKEEKEKVDERNKEAQRKAKEKAESQKKTIDSLKEQGLTDAQATAIAQSDTLDTVEIQNTVAKHIKSVTEANLTDFVDECERIYALGLSNAQISTEQVVKDASNIVTDECAKEVYEQGLSDAQEQGTERKTETVAYANKGGKVTIVDEENHSVPENTLLVAKNFAKLGFDVEFSDLPGMPENVNAYVDAKAGKIYVRYNSSHIIYDLLHESAEFTDAWNTEGFEGVKATIVQYMLNSEKELANRYVLEKYVKAYSEYGENGELVKSESYQDAVKEAVCDFIAGNILSSKDANGNLNFANVLTATSGENLTTIEKFKQFVNKIMDALLDLITGAKFTNYFTKLGANAEIDVFNDYMNAFSKAITNYKDSVVEGEQSGEQENSVSRYSLDVNFDKEFDKVIAGDNYYKNNVFILGKMPGLYSKFGLNTDYDLTITARHLKNAIKPKNLKKHHHGLTKDKIKNAVLKLDNPAFVMYNNNGVLYVTVSEVDNEIDRKPITFVIKPNGRVYIAGEEISSNHALSIYGRENTFEFIQSKINSNNILFENKNEVTKIEQILGKQFSNNLLNGNFEESISEYKKIVNSQINATRESRQVDSDGNALTQAQADYFKDSKVRDEDGNLLVVYHGTPNNFTVFDNRAVRYASQGHYFTANKEYASRYSQRTGNVLEGYINIEKPFDINNPKIKDLFIEQYVKGGYALGISPDSTDAEINNHIENGLDWTEADNLIDFIQENELDYDGLVLDEGGDIAANANGNETIMRGTSYVVFDSNQFKNTDNQNPTSNPDIRYSRQVTQRKDTDFKSVLDKTDYSNYMRAKRKLMLDNRYRYEERDFILIYNEANEVGSDERVSSIKIMCLQAFDIGGTIDPYLMYEIRDDIDEDSIQLFIKSLVRLERLNKSEKAINNVFRDCRHYNGKVNFIKYAGEGTRFYIFGKTGWRVSATYTPITPKAKYNGGGFTQTYGEFEKGLTSTDTRYSKDIYTPEELMKVAESSKEEAKKAKSRAKALENRTKALELSNTILKRELSKGKAIDKEVLVDTAKEVKSLLGTKTKYIDIALDLQKIYNRISNGKLKGEGAIAEVEALLGKLSENTSSRTDYAEEYKPVIDFLEGTELYFSPQDVSELQYAYGDNWRNHFTGRVKVNTTNPNLTSLDQKWQELGSVFGEGMFSSDLSSGDIATRFANALDTMYTRQSAQLSAEEQAEQREYVAQYVLSQHPSVASRDTVKTQLDNALKDVEKANKVIERTQNALEMSKEKFGDYKTERKKTEHRRHINRIRNDLESRLRSPRGGKYIPKPLVNAVIQVDEALSHETNYYTRGIAAQERIISNPKSTPEEISKAQTRIDNLVSQQTAHQNAVKELANTYSRLKSKIAEDGSTPIQGAVYNEVVDSYLKAIEEKVGDTPLYKMDLEQLELVDEMLTVVQHTVNDAIKLKSKQTQKDAWEHGSIAIKQIRDAAKYNRKATSPFTSLLTPKREFNKLGGYVEDSELNFIYNILNDGSKEEMRVLNGAYDYFVDLLRSGTSKVNYYGDLQKMNGINRFSRIDKKLLVDIGLTDKNGNKLLITHGMLASLALHLENEDNVRHIVHGGLIIPGLSQYYKGSEEAFAKSSSSTGLIGEMQISELRKQVNKNLTEYDKQWIKTVRKCIDEYFTPKLNETTFKAYGFEKATVKDYWPIHSDRNFLSQSFDDITKSISQENASFMKNRIQGTNPIMLTDISLEMSRMIKNNAKYIGMLLPMRDANLILNAQTSNYGDSVRAAINQGFGSKDLNYIKNYMQDLNGGDPSRMSLIDKGLARIRKNFVSATLMLNPTVSVKQTASYFAAGSVIGYKALAKALAMPIKEDGKGGFVISKANKELIEKYSPLLRYRLSNGSDQEMGDIRSSNNFYHNVPALFNWIAQMDGVTVGRLWYASQYFVDDNYSNLKFGTDEYFKKVAEIFEEVVEDTQPNYTTSQRTEFQRGANELTKSLFMFFTQRLQNFNILYDASAEVSTVRRRLANGEATKSQLSTANKKLARAVTSQLLSYGALTMMTFVASALMHSIGKYRDDDKELTGESVTKGLIEDLMSNILGTVPLGSELFDIVLSFIKGEESSGLENSSLNLITDITNNAIKINKAIAKVNNAKNDYEREKALKELEKAGEKAFMSSASIVGIPLNNAKRIAKSFKQIPHIGQEDWANYDVEKTFSDYLNKWFETGSKDDFNKAFKSYLEDYKKKGKTEKDAKTTIKGRITSEFKSQYIAGDSKTRADIRKKMYSTGLYDGVDDVIKRTNDWLK